MEETVARTVADPSGDMIPGLPDEIGMLCLARVPLQHRHSMSAVCRSWRYLFHDDVFWDVRREHSPTEDVLFVFDKIAYKNGVWHGLFFSTKTWFKLPEMPDDNRFRGNFTSAVVDEKLFVIGGCDRREWVDPREPVIVSSTVSYFDLRRYRWETTGSLNIPRINCIAGVIDNQLYVCSGYVNGAGPLGKTSTAEVYNPITRTWRLISDRGGDSRLVSSVVLEGKLYAVHESKCTAPCWQLGRWGVVYDPREDKWTSIPENLGDGWCGNPVEFQGEICVKRDRDSLLYPEDPPLILSYSPSENTWKLIVGEYISEYGCEHPGPLCDTDCLSGELVTLDGKLLTIHKSYDNCIIKDLTGNVLISGKFRRRCGTEGVESRILSDSHDEELAHDSLPPSEGDNEDFAHNSLPSSKNFSSHVQDCLLYMDRDWCRRVTGVVVWHM